MDVQLTWTDGDEAGDYVVTNVLSPGALVSRPENMDETVLHTFETDQQNYSMPVRVTMSNKVCRMQTSTKSRVLTDSFQCWPEMVFF